MCSQSSFSQEGTWKIDSVNFEGLEKTNENYLRQFINCQKGKIFQKNILQKDIQQLWYVGTNQQVHAKIDSLPNQKIKITFQLKEKKTLLPIINFGGIKDNIWYQLGFIDFNWLGYGHQFLAYYQNNDSRHSGQIYYLIPYLNQKWGMALNILQWRSREPLYFPQGTVNYDYDNFNAEITVIRNFGFRKKLALSTGIFREKYAKSTLQILDNPPGPEGLNQSKLSSKLQYSENHINYLEQYLDGFSWKGIYQTVYNLGDKTIFNSFIFQLRKFHRFRKSENLAFRFRFGISTNSDTPFAPFVVDSRVNLRGVGNRIDRGTAQLILNLEYRHTFLDKKNWAIQGVAFTDIGNWRSYGGTLLQLLDKKELRQFAGGGARIIYKRMYGATLRIDYGIDIFNPKYHGFVLGLGQYF